MPDPRLDELALPVLVRQWADARGATTLRQLASIPPAELTEDPDRSVVAQALRAVLERYFGRTWEELSSIDASGRVRPSEPRVPASWDELRLVLPAAMRAVPLARIGLPARLLNYAERGELHTLGELARESSYLLGLQGMGRITVHRSFLAILAYAERVGTPVVMLPAVGVAGGEPGITASAAPEEGARAGTPLRGASSPRR